MFTAKAVAYRGERWGQLAPGGTFEGGGTLQTGAEKSKIEGKRLGYKKDC